MKVKTWGKSWYEAIPHSRGYDCQACGDETLTLSLGFFKKCAQHIVGFNKDNYVAIFRCPNPNCGELFWFHLNEYSAKAVHIYIDEER